jgi:hypothetical protein
VWQITEAGLTVIIKKLLVHADLELKEVLLTGLVKVLECGVNENEENVLATNFESLGGLTLLEQMQYDKNQRIGEMASEILKRYYIIEEIH